DLDPVLPAAEPERGLLGGADGEGGGDFPHRARGLPRRADAVDDRAGCGRHGIARLWPEPNCNSPPGGSLHGSARVPVLAKLVPVAASFLTCRWTLSRRGQVRKLAATMHQTSPLPALKRRIWKPRLCDERITLYDAKNRRNAAKAPSLRTRDSVLG